MNYIKTLCLCMFVIVSYSVRASNDNALALNLLDLSVKTDTIPSKSKVKPKAKPLKKTVKNKKSNSLSTVKKVENSKFKATTYEVKDSMGRTYIYAAPYGLPTELKFNETHKDFGVLKTGQKFTHEFQFTNIGKQALNIVKVEAGCSCIILDYPKDPVLPGATGHITFTYEAKDSPGVEYKTISITANTMPNTMTLLVVTGLVEQ